VPDEKRIEKKTDKFEIITPQGYEEGDKPKRMKFVKKTSCDRCGSCCTASTPTLLRQDMDLFRSSILSFDNTYTIREGEQFMVKGEEEPFISAMELIKIRPKEGTAECIFYHEDDGCSIYERRPAQCETFTCWEMSEELTGLEAVALRRKALFGDIELISGIIDRHNERCDYNRLAEAVEKTGGGDEASAEEIADMLQYDEFVRSYLTEKFNIPESSMDLILGKPMTERIREFGLKIEKEGDEISLLPITPTEEK
jgi:Fe-S-cluster containining protein